MDGHFVPNLTFGPPVLEAVRRHAKKPIDVHVMERSPEHMIPVLASSGGDIVTVHIEGVADIDQAVDIILDAGAEPAVAIRPKTPVVGALVGGGPHPTSSSDDRGTRLRRPAIHIRNDSEDRRSV